jgi:hypothetical protein
MTKPESVWCPKCKAMKKTKADIPAQVSHYHGEELRLRNVWICKCETCNTLLRAMDVAPKLPGKNSLCAECGKKLYPK